MGIVKNNTIKKKKNCLRLENDKDKEKILLYRAAGSIQKTGYQNYT